MMQDQISPMTKVLADYIAKAASRELPQDVAAKAVDHVMDSVAAILSGSRLQAGELAIAYAAAQGAGESGVAAVLGTGLRAPVSLAALVNGFSAHADETDDSHLGGRFHPGCAIVPAALAAAEANGSSGAEFLRAVALGYDIGARAVMALGHARPDTAKHSSHSIGPLFGSAAAAASLYRLSPRQVRHALSYTVQQCSGVPFWQRDPDHIEKAFDFAGMGARNGVTAASLAAAGFTGIDDPFSGRHNYFSAFAEHAAPERLIEGLGDRFEIMNATTKKWCVGSPIQAMLDAVEILIACDDPQVAAIESVTIIMPDDRIHIVNNRQMPATCAQHLVAIALIDRFVTFASSHDVDRMADPEVLALRQKITLLPSAELTAAKPARQAIVEIVMADGRHLRHHASAVRGTPDNPMNAAELRSKAGELITPVIGARTEALLDALAGLAGAPSITPIIELATRP
ncbi:MmgE/PrpD family protein [Paracoccus onubensis]|uniref:MmgE/PrpD family protein n=1 Tax=Paracoccus onubensis TaxID=1675788 RepID=UPI00272F5EFB|nr:MmgE/PrpD family protein [Paracoccus onubensis]MDP0926170.1 MmgE/PrpD family protein [Paracoccus onubensis]